MKEIDMPISKKEFDSKGDSSSDHVLKLFVNKPDKAFTIKEISKQAKIDQMACFNVMLHWIERGMIEHKLIGKQYYYTLKRG
jgi:hypothetical protein